VSPLVARRSLWAPTSVGWRTKVGEGLRSSAVASTMLILVALVATFVLGLGQDDNKTQMTNQSMPTTNATVDLMSAVCCEHGAACGPGQLCLYRPDDRSTMKPHPLFFADDCPAGVAGGVCVCAAWSPATTTSASASDASKCREPGDCHTEEVCVEALPEGGVRRIVKDQVCADDAFCSCLHAELAKALANMVRQAQTTTTTTTRPKKIDESLGFTIKGSFEISVGAVDKFVKDEEVIEALIDTISNISGVPEHFVEIKITKLDEPDDEEERELSAGVVSLAASPRRLVAWPVRIDYVIRVPPAAAKGMGKAVAIKAADVKERILAMADDEGDFSEKISEAITLIDVNYSPEVMSVSQPVVSEGTGADFSAIKKALSNNSINLKYMLIFFLSVVGMIVLSCLAFAGYRYYVFYADPANIDPFSPETKPGLIWSLILPEREQDEEEDRPVLAACSSEKHPGKASKAVGKTTTALSEHGAAYEVGDAVEVRASPDAEWQAGRVVCASPLRIWPLSAPEDAPGMSWAFVRPLAGGEAPPVTREASKAKKWAAVEAALVGSQPLSSAIVVGERSRGHGRVSRGGEEEEEVAKEFLSGDRVFVRSHDKDPWQVAVVVDPGRKLVRLAGASEESLPTAWKHMRRDAPANGEEGFMNDPETSRAARGWQPSEPGVKNRRSDESARRSAAQKASKMPSNKSAES